MSKEKSKAEVINYYDAYTTRQSITGINERHQSIQRWLEKKGLKPDDEVLEIGCGIGTQTELLTNYLNSDTKVTAIDISPKSVDIAKQRLANKTNIKWIADDYLKVKDDHKYDVVLLPDVIEHIPLELHFSLFEKIASNLKEDGFVLIHIPNPLYLEWCEKYTPEKLQIIDQAVHTDLLVKNTRPHGFYIHFLSTYQVWVDNCDYRVIVLKKLKEIEKRKYKIVIPKQTITKRAIGKVKRILKIS